MSLFWRLDLEVFACTAEHLPGCDLDNPDARGPDWSLPESALANAVAAVKASLRQQDAIAEALLARAFQRLETVMPDGDLTTQIVALAEVARQTDPSVTTMAARVRALVSD